MSDTDEYTDESYDESEDTNLDENAFDNASLDDCFKYLHNPKINRNPPRVCYRKLVFPNDYNSSHPKLGNYAKFFDQSFANLEESSPLKAFPDGRLYVTYKLVNEIKKGKKRYLLIPIEYHQTKNNISAYYGILYDRVRREVEVFRFPGSDDIKEIYNIEKKINKLFREKLKLGVYTFYQSIHFKPDKNNGHYEYWPSWVVFHRIRHPLSERESTVNKAFEKVVKKDGEYRTFVNNYKKYLK